MSEQAEMTAQTAAQILSAPVEGALTAPIVFFDDAPAFAIIGGVGRVQLSAYVNEVGQDGNVFTRKVVVAHLRGNHAAFASLKGAINGMELLATPAEGGSDN